MASPDAGDSPPVADSAVPGPSGNIPTALPIQQQNAIWLDDGTPTTVEGGFYENASQSQVDTFAASNLRKANRRASRETGQKNMLFGALWCIGGILVTAFTYQAAAAGGGGGKYVVAWGAILFGGIQFVQGLIQQASE